MSEISKAMQEWVDQAKAASSDNPGGLHPTAVFNSSIGKTWEGRD
eukprot:SAG11_NODE_21711_length_420_cov_0.638629_1_plen_44_part_10